MDAARRAEAGSELLLTPFCRAYRFYLKYSKDILALSSEGI